LFACTLFAQFTFGVCPELTYFLLPKKKTPNVTYVFTNFSIMTFPVFCGYLNLSRRVNFGFLNLFHQRTTGFSSLEKQNHNPRVASPNYFKKLNVSVVLMKEQI
jgi:hypothetical protein